ncbi:outer membrane protein assembly factor BamB [Rhodoferax sp.]|uniref:outer membrane protein assembly factor BamB n=1 Tax=Rhodoferax sp. TaxID=50421 RepID=UPI00276672F9|nr:outer membrane protein assembly factor BamB [Rhodoferax sp.]
MKLQLLAGKVAGLGLTLGLALLLGACAGGPDKPKPTELAPNPGLMGVRQVWATKVGGTDFPLTLRVVDQTVFLANADGGVWAINVGTGAELWRVDVGAKVAAGVGSDGQFVALVTRDNELVVLDGGRELWRQKLSAMVFTSPLVAGRRVFVLGADRTVSAYDAVSGRKLWIQQRPGEPLVLRQAGVLLPVGDTLVAGLAGRLAGLSPGNGSVRWEVPIATPRGTNDVERLVDLVASASRVGESVCVRAFQSAVGCVNAARGNLLWTKPAAGAVGLGGDDRLLFGTEADGKVVAWTRASGERAWVSERLKYRGLSAPLALGRSVVIGDESGLLHFLSREDGSPLTRVGTDGSAVAAAPVVAGDTLIVATRGGSVMAFKPE